MDLHHHEGGPHDGLIEFFPGTSWREGSPSWGAGNDEIGRDKDE